MILFSIGLPSCFAEWCDAILTHLARHALGSIPVIAANSLNDAARTLIQHGADSVLVCSRLPATVVQDALTSGGRFALTIEDPREAVAHLVLNRGYDLVAATRVVAGSSAAVTRFDTLPGALVLGVGGDLRAPETIAARLAGHFGLALDATAILEAVETVERDGYRLSVSQFDEWWSALSKRDRLVVTGATDGYREYLATGQLGQLVWQRELFFLEGGKEEPATRSVDITGRPRCFLYGPFFRVSPGAWTARVVIAVSKEAAGVSLGVEAFAGAELGRTTICPRDAGVFEVGLDFEINEAGPTADEPFQIRIFNDRAAFDGKVGLGVVSLIPQARAVQVVQEDLAVELGLTLQ